MRNALLRELKALGAIAIVRIDETEKILPIVEALLKGGVRAIELTMTMPRTLDLLGAVAETYGDDVLLGAGSVLDAGTAQQAVDAGARYIVSPVFKREVIEASHEAGALAMPAAFTPTEAQAAFEAGADVIKLFPARTLGLDFLSSLLAPLPHLKIMPTGGVTIENAGDWLVAGAHLVGLGSALLDSQAIRTGQYDVLRNDARRLCQVIKEARAAI